MRNWQETSLSIPALLQRRVQMSCPRPGCQSAVCFLGYAAPGKVDSDGGVRKEREGGGEDEQSADLPAKICEPSARPVAGADPAPVEQRGLGGGAGGGEQPLDQMFTVLWDPQSLLTCICFTDWPPARQGLICAVDLSLNM